MLYVLSLFALLQASLLVSAQDKKDIISLGPAPFVPSQGPFQGYGILKIWATPIIRVPLIDLRVTGPGRISTEMRKSGCVSASGAATADESKCGIMFAQRGGAWVDAVACQLEVPPFGI